MDQPGEEGAPGPLAVEGRVGVEDPDTPAPARRERRSAHVEGDRWRRDIQGLRGVAILAVVIYHADPALLPGGFIGVDLFFVISGFVVTLSLVRLLPPLEGETSFVAAFERAKQALKTFYTRRFFRIMPAALAALLVNRFMMTIFPQSFGTPMPA